jgi:hypothetical protein
METLAHNLRGRLLPVLDTITEKSLIELGFQTAVPLLNGVHLSEFLHVAGTIGPKQTKHGLYFIFYIEKEIFAPIYVGKDDKIPTRILQHFGQLPYIDQVLATHTGGRHYYATHFSNPLREAYDKGLGTIAVRFVFIEDEKNRVLAEKAFITALQPIANGGTYIRKGLNNSKEGYVLHGLAEAWLSAKGVLLVEENHSTNVLQKYQVQDCGEAEETKRT